MFHSCQVSDSKRISDFKEHQFAAALVLTSVLTLGISSGNAQAISPLVAQTQGITFLGLNGPDLSPFSSSYVEGNFAVTPTSGTWLESTRNGNPAPYGNPAPCILAGPVNSPQPAVIQITDSVGNFTLSGLDFSSNNGNSLFDLSLIHI